MVERLSAHEIQEIRKAFSVFDVDGDGAITSKELADVMRSFGLNPSEDELMDMINKFDIDGDGMVSFPEFLQMMAPNEDDYQKDIAEVVQMFDTQNNGYMDLTEIENILMRFGNGGEGPPDDKDRALINEMMSEFRSHSGWSAEYHYFRTEDAIQLLTPEDQRESPAAKDPDSASTSLRKDSSSKSKTDRSYGGKPSKKPEAARRQSSFALGASKSKNKRDSKEKKGPKPGEQPKGGIDLRNFCNSNLMYESTL